METVEYFNAPFRYFNVQVVEKIMPINESGSDSFWENDTVEVFRACPQYGAQDSNETVLIIGRNFRESNVLLCRYTPCMSSSVGPRKCDDPSSSGTNGKSIHETAIYISSTRVECPLPEYSFPSNRSLLVLDGVCAYDEAGVLAYIQPCELDDIYDGSCTDGSGTGYRFVYEILVNGLTYFSSCGTELRTSNMLPFSEPL